MIIKVGYSMIKILKLMLLLWIIILSCCCVLLFGFDEGKELDEFFFLMLKKWRRVKWKLQCPDYLLVLLTVFFVCCGRKSFFWEVVWINILRFGIVYYLMFWNCSIGVMYMRDRREECRREECILKARIYFDQSTHFALSRCASW